MAIVRDLFGGRRLVVMLSRLALVSGVAPVAAPLSVSVAPASSAARSPTMWASSFAQGTRAAELVVDRTAGSRSRGA